MRSWVAVWPSPEALHITQQRAREKQFLADRGFPTVPFAVATTQGELASVLGRIGTPAIVKTAESGYDGKGQQVAASADQAERIWASLGAHVLVVEKRVNLQAELSVIAARGLDGGVAQFPLFENRHRNHILDLTTAPALVAPDVAARATAIAHGILDALEYVGVLCIEFFLSTDGELMVNELAPRPHNSGHLTFDAAVTSQFEQQVRAICGLPLGSPELLRPAAMANLLGDLWADGEPNWEAACRLPEVKLHLYGKVTPKPGRKMGHLTAMGRTVHEAQERVIAARDALLG
jgi:5-(carboxyamino)imidazole ribonucleotide synthase